jgi:2-dehydro-3-deoxy-D-gluconate 5-dehydrogenase
MKAIITGGSRGIGRAIVNQLVKMDYDVVSIGRSEDNDIRCDLTVSHANLITEPVDVLVNNAGFQYYAPAVNYPMTEWYRQSEMLAAYFDLSRQAYLHGATRIINIASTAGMRGTRGSIGYSVAKAGVIHMTKCLSNEWAGKCTVNCIAPGFIETGMLDEAFRDEEHKERVKRYIPVGEFGNTSDVAGAVEFLIHADYVTGVILPVDGGFTGL